MAYRRLRMQCTIATLLFGSSLVLTGCGGGGVAGGGDATTTAKITTSTQTTSSTTTTLPYFCETDAWLDTNLQNMASKGMAIDDTTMSKCPESLLGVWPNTKSERVTSVRLFAAWKSQWGGESSREAAWSKLVAFINANNVKVLLGVDTTTNKAENEKQWHWGLALMKKLEKDKILGFSFGNEMLNKHGIDWDGYMTSWVKEKVGEMDAAGFEHVKLTVVWSMNVLPRITGKNFHFLHNIYQTYIDRWIWSVNPYSIWDVHLQPYSTADCHAKTDAALSVGYLRDIMTAFRKAVTAYTGNPNAPIWIGETGWASPFAVSLKWIQSHCEYFGSVDALKKYYQNFLEWDGSLNGGLKGIELMFYFTNRDAMDGWDRQPFGLVSSSSSPKCKIQVAALTAPSAKRNQTLVMPSRVLNASDTSDAIVI